MKRTKERVIFSTYGAMTYEEMQEQERSAKEFLEEIRETDEPITDEEVMQEVYNMEEMWYDDEKLNLNKKLNGRILAIADVGRWNGRCSGYKILGDNLNEILWGMGDSVQDFRVWADVYTVKAVGHHHDASHYVEYRELKEDTDYDKLLNKLYNNDYVSRAEVYKYTRSLRPYIKEVFGV